MAIYNIHKDSTNTIQNLSQIINVITKQGGRVISTMLSFYFYVRLILLSPDV